LRRCPDGGLPQAWAALLPARERFPQEPVIPYNLACYAAQMNRLDEAFEWLRQAVTAAGKADPIRQMATQDPDLEALRHRLKEL
jgi:Flp pilus assembly protein TadD